MVATGHVPNCFCLLMCQECKTLKQAKWSDHQLLSIHVSGNRWHHTQLGQLGPSSALAFSLTEFTLNQSDCTHSRMSMGQQLPIYGIENTGNSSFWSINTLPTNQVHEQVRTSSSTQLKNYVIKQSLKSYLE